ncbi:hypothetical protein V6N13_036120 [Hibiscus sabdariffa]
MSNVEDDLAHLSIGDGEDDGVQIELGDCESPLSFQYYFVGQSCAKLKESLNLGNVSCSQEGLPNFREVNDHTKSGGRGMDDGPKSDALGSGLVKDTMGPIVGFDVEMGLLE